MSFKYFVVFAEMRTGSNLLESNINEFDNLNCLGEVFNPNFVGYPKTNNVLGFDQKKRDKDPLLLLNAISDANELNGFRYFHDHEPRILKKILRDKKCAKIVLTRNPIDSYISLKIARSTGQWKLTNANNAKTGVVKFDGVEFEKHLQKTQDFQVEILNAMQKSGQSAFYIGYDDLHDMDVLNGLATWLGCKQQLEQTTSNLKPQNPKSPADKVLNPEAMEQSLARLDRFNLTRTPNFEPRRGPVVPSYLTGAKSPLLYQGIHGGPTKAIHEWMARLDNVAVEDLKSGMTQAELRKWQRQNKGHRAFTVLRHPLARAHAAFCEKILPNTDDAYLFIRRNLNRFYGLSLPEDTKGSYDHRAGFEAFLNFLEANLNGQTAIRVDPWWTSQATVLEGFSGVRVPDMLIRETDLAEGLTMMALQANLEDLPTLPETIDPHAEKLAEIYDKDLEKRVRRIYQRDFISFGFGRWK